MKVKVITTGSQFRKSETDFEKMVNEFIKDKFVIDIKYGFSYHVANNSSGSTYSAMILYEED